MEFLDANNNFLAIEKEYSSLDNSSIIIVLAPYEYRTSYGGGTIKGPEEILKASAYVEFYDNEFDRELCFEEGIATLKPIEFENKIDKEALNVIQENIDKLLDKEKLVVNLGGEHTISIAPSVISSPGPT